MTRATLYSFPGACSRVTATALIQAGLEVDARLVDFPKGAHKSSDYRAINAFSKVPVLELDGRRLTETPAIIMYLDALYPAAGLLPAAETPYETSLLFADLNICAALLHPFVSRIRIPQRFAVSQAARAEVKSNSIDMLNTFLEPVEARLSSQPWWYGDRWSMMDSYLEWIIWRSCDGGYDLSPFPRLADMVRRAADLPAAVEARRIEAAQTAQLAAFD